MYVGSAADAAGLQALASAAAVRRWGSGPAGREVIAHSVCKGKYQPWKGGLHGTVTYADTRCHKQASLITMYCL